MTRRPPQRGSDLRGTNYIPSTMAGTDYALGLVRKDLADPFLSDRQGLFDPLHSRTELAAIAGAGFNNIRLWSGWWAWMVDPVGYTDTLTRIVQQCHDLGLTMTYIVWNSADASLTPSQPAGYVLSSASTIRQNVASGRRTPEVLRVLWLEALGRHFNYNAKVPLGEPWFAGGPTDPGNLLFEDPRYARFAQWPADFLWLMDEYLRQLGAVFDTHAGRTVLFSYDLFNEPDYLRETFQLRRELVLDVIQFTYQRLQRPWSRETVGLASMSKFNKDFIRDLHLTRGVRMSYLSSHGYRIFHDLSSFVSTIQDAANFAGTLGLDYACTEFWERRLLYPARPPIKPYLDILRGFRAGGQMWGFLESNNFFTDVLAFPPPTGADVFRRILPEPVPVRLSNLPPEAVDGILQPARGTWTPFSGQPWPRGQVPTFPMRPTGSQADLDAIRTWSIW